MAKDYCIKSWVMTEWEEAHATSSINGTVLQWQHLAHPPWVPLQLAELVLFYTMKLEWDREKKKCCCCAVCPLVSPWQFCHKQPVLFTHPSATAMIRSQFVPLRLSHSIPRTIHANPFSCWLTYAKSRTLTFWDIFPLGNFALLCHVPLYPPCLLHHLRSGSSSMLWWDSAFLPLLHPHRSKRNFSK